MSCILRSLSHNIQLPPSHPRTHTPNETSRPFIHAHDLRSSPVKHTEVDPPLAQQRPIVETRYDPRLVFNYELQRRRMLTLSGLAAAFAPSRAWLGCAPWVRTSIYSPPGSGATHVPLFIGHLDTSNRCSIPSCSLSQAAKTEIARGCKSSLPSCSRKLERRSVNVRRRAALLHPACRKTETRQLDSR